MAKQKMAPSQNRKRAKHEQCATNAHSPKSNRNWRFWVDLGEKLNTYRHDDAQKAFGTGHRTPARNIGPLRPSLCPVTVYLIILSIDHQPALTSDPRPMLGP
jgi:hypothetical protein